MALKRSSCEFK